MSKRSCRLHSERFPAVILLGPTGSGKTPLGAYLEASGLWGCRARHFDLGEHLRRIAVGDCPAGLTQSEMEYVSSVVRDGALFEDRDFPLIERILRDFLDQAIGDGNNVVILNGLPRHLGQALRLEQIVTVSAVLVLECKPAVVFERLRADPEGDRSGRSDDTAEQVWSRLALYETRTVPIIDYYVSRGVAVFKIPVTATTRAQHLAAQIASLRGEVLDF